MAEYVLTANIGHSLDDAIERTSSENAIIIKYESGLRKEYIEWNPLTARIYNPGTDPRYYKQQKIVMRAGEQILGKDIPPGMLTAGMSPFYQILYHIISRGTITSEEDIIRSLTGEERVFSYDDPNSIEIIKGILKKMNEEEFHILKHHGSWKVGFELPKAYHLVEYKRGYDPIEYHMIRYIENRGVVSVDEIYNYVIEYLGWLKTPTKIDYYLNRLVKKGCIVKVQKNFYRFVRPLESNK